MTPKSEYFDIVKQSFDAYYSNSTAMYKLFDLLSGWHMARDIINESNDIENNKICWVDSKFGLTVVSDLNTTEENIINFMKHHILTHTDKDGNNDWLNMKYQLFNDDMSIKTKLIPIYLSRLTKIIHNTIINYGNIAR